MKKPVCPINYESCQVCEFCVGSRCRFPYKEGDTVLTLEKIAEAKKAIEEWESSGPEYLTILPKELRDTFFTKSVSASFSGPTASFVNPFVKEKETELREEIIYDDDL